LGQRPEIKNIKKKLLQSDWCETVEQKGRGEDENEAGIFSMGI